VSTLDTPIAESVNVDDLTPERTLDNRGGDCASGFVKLLEEMEKVHPGGLLAIRSTDPASRRELREWVGRAGHTMVDMRTTGPFWKREFRFLIRKGD